MARAVFPVNAEAALLEQLSDIERRISDLEDERAALQRLLARLRRQNVASQEVTRRNSFNRILVEKSILDRLSDSSKPVATPDLYRNAKNIVYSLNENTLRSHLHRMKKKGVIDHGPTRGTWVRSG